VIPPRVERIATTVVCMSTPRRWSLLVPVLGVVAAVVLLPVATLPAAGPGAAGLLAYLVVWVPLATATVVGVAIAARRRAEPWWCVLAVPVTVTGALLGGFVGLLARLAAIGLELAATGRIGAGSVVLDGGVESASSTLLAASVVAASVLVAPVVEESFFRGTLQPAIAERLGAGIAAGGAVVITAAVFAAVHALAGGGVLATIVTFVAGIGFGVVARSSGVGSAIVAHAVFNAAGLALAAG
jgi:membrane protease YdiL (CAAX protease family)